jgi:DNA primase catalytic core
MARIPEEELERVKREVSLAGVVREHGIELGRHGTNDLAGRCPFHSPDHTPSFIVSEGVGLYHCLGCDAAGNVIQFVERIRRVDFRTAALSLGACEDGNGDGGARPACPLSVGMSDTELGLGAVGFYHETLVAGGEGWAYLAKRGLDDEEMGRRFLLGESNRTLGRLIPEKNWKAGAELRGRLQGLGLWRASGHEHAAGSVVVPIFDQEGALAELYARKIRDDLRAGTPKHLYLPGPHRGVWNREALSEYDEVLLCEGGFDALTYSRWGLHNVTWVYGVEGLTDELFEALVANVGRVLLSYDGDAAGDRGVTKHAERLMAAGVECFRVPIPRGQDVNSYALSVSDPADALTSLVRQARWLGRGAKPAASVPGARVEEPEPCGPERAAPLAASPLAAETIGAAYAPLASPVPVLPLAELPVEEVGEDVWARVGDRHYRVRGLWQTPAHGALKVGVLAVHGEGTHSDVLELTVDANRQRFARRASEELGVAAEVIARDLSRLLLWMEILHGERLAEAARPVPAEPAMSETEREEAMALLRDPDLLGRIGEDFRTCGIVGEEENVLVGYLAAVSRKLPKPLGVLIQSSSAAGKSSLMEAILAFVPEEERVKYSAMTGQSLFYMSETNLRHRVLAIVEEEGAERASYALKLLLSEGELTIASTGKDGQTGRLVTHEYHVEGPVSVLVTTTAVEIDEELLNRCIVLTVDEEREQTRAIHHLQRELATRAGLWAEEERADVWRLHRNAQRLLRPLKVVNPYARYLTFLDDKTRTRRDHLKYQGLINATTLLHQYQRPIQTEQRNGKTKQFVEVTLSDIAVANRLAHEVLGRSLDELPPQTRRFAGLLARLKREECERRRMSRAEYRCTQREMRRATGWSAAAVKAHLAKLVELEYVIAHAGKGGQPWTYEVLYDGEGEAGAPFVIGLLDVEELRRLEYDQGREDSRDGREDDKRDREGGGRPAGGRREVGGSGAREGDNATGARTSDDGDAEGPKNAHLEKAAGSES